MRFLKTKILLAKEALLRKNTLELNTKPLILESIILKSSSIQEIETAKTSFSNCKKQPRGRRIKSQKKSTTGNSRATKNIVINYGKAIASFASSSLATPYLKQIIETEPITLEDFSQFAKEAKDNIGGIDSFRVLLLIEDKDSQIRKTCKRVFAKIAEVFIKYFSVNWITHGRVTHKLVYLKYRFKVLRRIQNPMLFTYISEGKKR